MPETRKVIKTEPQHNVHNHHVKFGEDVKPEDKEDKPRSKSPAPAPSEISTPPPTVPHAIKDEIELLRAGLRNKHGDHIRHIHKETPADA